MDSTLEKPRRSNRKYLLISAVVGAVLLASLCMMLLGFFVTLPRFRVAGYAMEPNLHNGQFLLVNRYIYLMTAPVRGDIIVFRFPLNPQRAYLERIIGLPGEKIQVRSGQVLINDVVLREPAPIIPAEYDWGPATMGRDEYFVLGDNRPDSSDSHLWGPVTLDLIVGKVWLCYWPPANWGWVH